VGKQVRCKHCGADFAIPKPGVEEPDVYALEEPADSRAKWVPKSSTNDAVFVPSRADERFSSDRPKRERTDTASPSKRNREADPAWKNWLIGGGIGFVLTVSLIALLSPHGTWVAGCILLVVGSLMILAGYAAGAYGAFQEDVLYGLFYLAIPLYTAYYMVTRWDDLWVWFTCSTVGVGLVLLGTELIRWAAAPI
jgi:hypothetical protein